jgi:hypothetical protein
MIKDKKHKVISLKLEGDKITSDKLRSSIGNFYGFVDEVASEISGRKKPIKWIVRVKKGSIILANEPEIAENLNPAITDRIFESIKIGIESLEKVAHRPLSFSDRALEYLQGLAAIPKGRSNGLTGIHISIDRKPHKLTSHVIANVDSILGVYSKALGSIEGKLQTISERGGYKFIVYDSLSDKPVRCDIDEDLILEATRAFGKRIYVYGVISYDKNGVPKSIRVQEFKVFKERETLPSAFEVCGILGA